MNKKDDTISKLDKLIDAIDNSHIDLISLFCDNNHALLEDIINYYLEKIKNIKCKTIDFSMCNELLIFFDYNYGVSNEDVRRINYSIMEEANIICDDLINKINYTNKRSITLPINLNYLIDYSISSYISLDDLNKVIYYLIIKLAIIYSHYKK